MDNKIMHPPHNIIFRVDIQIPGLRSLHKLIQVYKIPMKIETNSQKKENIFSMWQAVCVVGLIIFCRVNKLFRFIAKYYTER